MAVHIPKYRRKLDRTRGRDTAFSEFQGKRTYFPGRYDSPESREAYGRFVQRYLAQKRAYEQAPAPKPDGYTVGDLALAYLDHARVYYLRAGKPSSEYHCVRSALKPLLVEYMDVYADTFGPRDLKTVRSAMVALGWKRITINHAVGRIRRMFRWAVENELVHVGVLEALRAVSPLKRGRTMAEDGNRVLPVSAAAVDAVLPHLSPVVADMVRLQRLTGMRSESLCAIRTCDIDRSGEVWLYRPASHKTDYQDRVLAVAIGPQAQVVLHRYIANRPADAYCFSPAESEAQRSRSRRAARKSPMTPSQAARGAESGRARPVRSHYSPAGYRRAIQRTIDRLNVKRTAAGQSKIPRWHPHQLRHTVGTMVRKRFGLEAAQVVLGHSQADVTQIYAERDLDLAKQVAQEIG